MSPELDPADRAALIALLRTTIAADRFPLSPRIRRLKVILSKLEPPAAPISAHPVSRRPGKPSMMLRKGRR